MGIPKTGASLLYELRGTRPLGSSVLQLGKQSLYVEADQIPGIAAQHGFDVHVDDVLRDENGEYIEETYNDVTFFKKLGFTTVHSLDYSDYEGADIVHDLNNPVPEHLHDQYDFIYEGGTLEHVFDFPQSLRNVHDLLKVGGVVAHDSPSRNHVDHVCYMYSATVFWDYYNANLYKVLKSYIYEYETEHTAYTGTPWKVYEYSPAAIEHLVAGGWGRKRLGIWFVAEKTEKSRCDVIPQQGAYRNTWAETPSYDPYANYRNRSGPSPLLRQRVKAIPVLGSIISVVFRGYRWLVRNHLPQSRPPTIGDY